MFYQVKTSSKLRLLYKGATWFIPNTQNKIYLTFDDGPVAGITDNVLDILKEHQAVASFFCVGQNIERNRSTFDRIISEGHSVGNHSQTHMNGWLKGKETYLSDWNKCNKEYSFKYFRPPYGKIKRSQFREISKHQKVVFWDVLSADFDPKKGVEDIVNNVVSKTESGSIIVLHDNEKCGKKMLLALPTIIQTLKDKGFIFDNLDSVI